MNIKQLKFVSSLAAKKSFTQAADECCVTQPTLSNNIAQLEDELGERLFQRSTRKVQLTPFGTKLMPYIEDVINAEKRLSHQAEILLKPDVEMIRIGMSPLINGDILKLILEPFRLQNPDIEIVLREMNMNDLDHMLAENLLDFVFGVSQDVHDLKSSTFLYNEPLVFLNRGEAPNDLKERRSLLFKEIADETYVMVPNACGLARATRTLFRRHRKTIKEYSGEALSYQVLSEWAALGIGAAILPRSKKTDKDQPFFHIQDKAGDDVLITFDAIWNRSSLKIKHLEAFFRHLQKVVPRIVAGLEPSQLINNQ